MVSLQVLTAGLLLLCGSSTVYGSVFQVKQRGYRVEIDHLTDNKVQQAFASIQSAWNVKELDLSGNPLSRISGRDLYAFSNLELLNLSSNVLYDTVDLSSLTKLRTVDLNNNFIQRVIVGPAIETLHAANNNISYVGCTGRNMYGTKKIYLAHNKISSLHDLDNFCRQRIEYLDVKLNEIETLDFGQLSESTDTLKEIFMEYNFIYEVRNSKSISFPYLNTLDLSSNKLAFLGPAFEAVINVRSINLSNNKLVLLHDIYFGNAHTVDLRGNGMQCETIRTFLGITKASGGKRNPAPTRNYANPKQNEVCDNESGLKRVSIYCCEELSAPFADRLIDLKRKELALYSGHSTEQDRRECEQENESRRNKIKEIESKYRTTIDVAARNEQEKIKLTNEINSLEGKKAQFELAIADLQNLLDTTATSLGLDQSTKNQDPLKQLQSIVQWYEDKYVSEQATQNNAIRDFERYQLMEEQLLEENERLKKLNQDADLSFAAVNATYTTLLTKEKELATYLAARGSAP